VAGHCPHPGTAGDPPSQQGLALTPMVCADDMRQPPDGFHDPTVCCCHLFSARTRSCRVRNNHRPYNPGVYPFVGLIIVGLGLCVAFPQIILWLSSVMIK